MVLALSPSLWGGPAWQGECSRAGGPPGGNGLMVLVLLVIRQAFFPSLSVFFFLCGAVCVCVWCSRPRQREWPCKSLEEQKSKGLGPKWRGLGGLPIGGALTSIVAHMGFWGLNRSILTTKETFSMNLYKYPISFGLPATVPMYWLIEGAHVLAHWRCTCIGSMCKD